MIQSNEVRRNNWVLFEGNPYQIDIISEDAPFLNTPEFGVGVVSWDNISGIPLTPELLEKCGFKLVPEGIENVNNPYYAKNCICLFFNHSDTSIYLMGYGYAFEGRTYAATTRWVKHLHEVQNFYQSTTGTELTVTI